jgi:hypothetical protein
MRVHLRGTSPRARGPCPGSIWSRWQPSDRAPRIDTQQPSPTVSGASWRPWRASVRAAWSWTRSLAVGPSWSGPPSVARPWSLGTWPAGRCAWPAPGWPRQARVGVTPDRSGPAARLDQGLASLVAPGRRPRPRHRPGGPGPARPAGPAAPGRPGTLTLGPRPGRLGRLGGGGGHEPPASGYSGARRGRPLWGLPA